MTRADTSALLPRPAVSIIIAAFNAAATIRETLDSVLEQTYGDFEAIVVDDGSTDETAAIVGGFEDPRVRLHRYANAGLSGARNRGLGLARGEYIAFLDADDVWTADKLELQVAALRARPNAGVAYSWVIFVDEDGRDLHPRRAVDFEGDVRPHLLLDCFPATASNPLLTRTCVESTGAFDTTLERAEDWDYWLRASRDWPFVVVPRYQTRYRVSQHALSAGVEVFVRDARIVLDRAFADAPPELRPLRPKALARFERYAAFVYVTRTPGTGWRRHALRQLVRAVRRWPHLLLERETYDVLAAWVVSLAPGSLGPRAVRALLRVHGRRVSRRLED
jgi:glycosyltransferase involved in cell wall biosynthesis